MIELSQASADDPTLLRSGFAGDTMNTAWYLAQLRPGWDIQYLTHVGKDRPSERMISFLGASSIGTEFVHRRDDATLGLYLIERDASGERSFLYWRNQSAARHLADAPERLANAVRTADVVYFSGITLAILPPGGRDRLLDAISTNAKPGAKIVFDPNLRPRLWEDPETMRQSVTKAAGRSAIVLPSFEDEAMAFGDASPAMTLERYAATGAEEIVVKNGGATIHVSASSGSYTHDPNVVPMVDSTAAGDSFNAGYLAARLAGLTVADALCRGAEVSEKVVQSPGALVPVQPA